jgi:hypothetical protein
MVTMHSNLMGWLRSVEADPSDPVWNDGYGLLYSCNDGFEAALSALEDLTPVADRLVLLESNLRSMINQLATGDQQSFPLRNRFEQGWLKSKGDFMRMTAEGIETLMNGGDPQAFRAGLANLSLLVREGNELNLEAQEVARLVHSLDRRYEKPDPEVEAWVERVILEANRKRDLAAESLAVVRDRAHEQRARFAEEWKALRPKVLNNFEGTRELQEDLLNRSAQMEKEYLAPFPEVAQRLGVLPPRN